jgi:hypothetical protein
MPNNIAVASGTPSYLIQEVVSYMVSRRSIDLETAQEYVQAYDVYESINSSKPEYKNEPNFSTLYVKIDNPYLIMPITYVLL